MRDRVNKSAIEQAQHIGTECRLHAGAVGSIAVLKERVLPVFLHALAVHDRDGYLCAIARRREQSLRLIIIAIKTAEHSAFLDLSVLFAGHIEIVGGLRRRHRFVGVAEPWRVEFVVIVGIGGIHVFTEIDSICVTRGSFDYFHLLNAVFDDRNHEVVLENLDVLDQCVIAMSNNFRPGVFRPVIKRRLQNAKVFGTVI